MYHQKEKMFGFLLPDLIQIITSDYNYIIIDYNNY